MRRGIILLIVKHQVLSHLTATSICTRFPFHCWLSFNTTLSVLRDISHVNILHYADHIILCRVAIHGLCVGCLTIIIYVFSWFANSNVIITLFLHEQFRWFQVRILALPLKRNIVLIISVLNLLFCVLRHSYTSILRMSRCSTWS
mgnify:CR=1 FL=1